MAVEVELLLNFLEQEVEVNNFPETSTAPLQKKMFRLGIH